VTRSGSCEVYTHHDELFVEAPVRHFIVERHDVLSDENVPRTDTQPRRSQFQVDVELLHVTGRPGLRQLSTQLTTNLRRTPCIQSLAATTMY